MDSPDFQSNLQAAIEAGERLTTLHKVEGYKPCITSASMNGLAAQMLVPDKLDKPRFLTACPIFNDAAAFIAYFNRFKDDTSRIFYTQEGVAIGVLDYHAQADEPRHGDHLIKLALKRSPEWDIWKGNSEKGKTQAEFAEFLEDNAHDIVSPTPVEMLEVATGLNAMSSAIFRRAINQANGQIQMQYDENIDARVAGGTKEVPTTFQIGLRAFMGCDRCRVDCRLRYRIQSGSLTFHYKALHLDWVSETALNTIVEKIAKETQTTPALGMHDPAAFAKGM